MLITNWNAGKQYEQFLLKLGVDSEDKMEAFNYISRTVITVPYARAQITSVNVQFCTASKKHMGDGGLVRPILNLVTRWW